MRAASRVTVSTTGRPCAGTSSRAQTRASSTSPGVKKERSHAGGSTCSGSVTCSAEASCAVCALTARPSWQRPSPSTIARRAAPPGVEIVGPAPAPLARLRNRYRYRFMVRSASRGPLRHVLVAVQRAETDRRARVVIDVDPVSML